MTFDRAFLREYFLKPLCYAAVIVVVLFLLNKFTYFNFSLGSNNSYNSFEVIGVGKVTVVPDVATTNFTVTEKGKTEEAARAAANVRQNQAVSSLQKIGIAKEDIKTTGFYVNPNYEEGDPYFDNSSAPDAPQSINITRPGSPTQNGYVATISTQVKAKDINDMNKAIDALTAIGLTVSGVEYTQADQEKYVMEAQSKAIQDAKVQAESIAKTAGFRLGQIVTIRNADDSSYGQPYPADSMSLKASPENTGTELQPGSNEVTARMGVTYNIKN